MAREADTDYTRGEWGHVSPRAGVMSQRWRGTASCSSALTASSFAAMAATRKAIGRSSASQGCPRLQPCWVRPVGRDDSHASEEENAAAPVTSPPHRSAPAGRTAWATGGMYSKHRPAAPGSPEGVEVCHTEHGN